MLTGITNGHCLVQNVQVTRLRWADSSTVPNLVSVAGLLLTVHGARRLHTPAGIAEVTVGRLLDLADGYLARALDQSSQSGPDSTPFSIRPA